MRPIGHHVIVDVWEADPAVLNHAPTLGAALETACKEAGATLMGTWKKTFTPQGVTVLVCLSESHASIHTYPELGYYAADMFTCGALNPTEAVIGLVRRLGGRANGLIVPRGEGLEVKFEPIRFTFEPAPGTSSELSSKADCSS